MDLATPSWSEILLQKQVWGLNIAQVLISTLCDDLVSHWALGLFSSTVNLQQSLHSNNNDCSYTF